MSFGNPATMGLTSPPIGFSNLMTATKEKLPPHSQHPAFGHLTLLVFEAVLEVVCVSLPGYIVARQGMFNAEMQKFAANLNVMLFTPCLIFTKLASQLTADTIGELALIPVIFLVQTLVSYLGSIAMSKLFRFEKRPRNFVIAMGVFGNSNSLPISLVLSLSQTIKGLHWDKIANDNDDEVAARGILYLLIFQQLGQLLRWSWGYNVLLAPPEQPDEERNDRLERGQGSYSENPNLENERLLIDTTIDDEDEQYGSNTSSETNVEERGMSKGSPGGLHSEQHYVSGEQTPVTHRQYTSSVSSEASSSRAGFTKPKPAPGLLPTPANGNVLPSQHNNNQTSTSSSEDELVSDGPWGMLMRCKLFVKHQAWFFFRYISAIFASAFVTLPSSLRKGLSNTFAFLRWFLLGLWSFMNPPLWAMLAAIVVAAIPSLQSLFFSEGTFVKNSITSAVSQSAGVAVPLILVVLGANLARNTLPDNLNGLEQDKKEETKLLIAALVSRMLLPTIIMTPILALTAKYTPISILEDPIFVIVCFLLTGAPSALQLAQICQINNVYMGTITRLLFQSYVVWILPSTLVLVMLALEVVEWAGA